MVKTQRGEAKLDHLLEKGMEILWSKGYNGTSVNDIVRAAGIPKGSFYFYFKSKEDFAVKAIHRYADEEFVPMVRILEDTSSSAKQRLLNVYEHRIQTLKEDFNCQKGCMACNLSSEMSEHNENIRKAILEIHAKMRAPMVKVALEAQEAGEINPSINVHDLIEFFENAGKGAMISMKESQSSYPIENVMNMIRQILSK
ncbi:MAG: TetR/AcrR family transcriptional regulator [Bacteroidota bacterium]